MLSGVGCSIWIISNYKKQKQCKTFEKRKIYTWVNKKIIKYFNKKVGLFFNVFIDLMFQFSAGGNGVNNTQKVSYIKRLFYVHPKKKTKKKDSLFRILTSHPGTINQYCVLTTEIS